MPRDRGGDISERQSPLGFVQVADAIDGLARLPAESVDTVVTDPPYGWAYMGARWDDFGSPGAYQEFTRSWASAAGRVLRKDGHMLVFAAARTYHFMAMGLVEAGFDVVDQLQWLHGQGMPKGASLLRPAHEPIALAVRAGGSPRLRVRDAMIPAIGREPRYPANVMLDGVAGLQLDDQAGHRVSGARRAGVRRDMGYHGASGDGGPSISANQGGASRFFFASKVRRRDEQLHPTQKPLDLMEWLLALVTAPGEIVLDPFLGSGTTALAAERTGRRWLGFEMDASTADLATRRIADYRRQADPPPG